MNVRPILDQLIAKFRVLKAAPSLFSALEEANDFILISCPQHSTRMVLPNIQQALAKARGIRVTEARRIEIESSAAGRTVKNNTCYGIALLLVCLISLSACSGFTRGGNSLTSPGLVDVAPVGSGHDSRPMSLIVGTWIGQCPATNGESGACSIVVESPISSENPLTLRGIWTSAVSGLSFRFTASGLLSNLTIVSDPGNPVGPHYCGYVATAQLNAAEDTLSGTAHGTGGGPCDEKRLSFTLTRQGPPPCTGSGTLPFNPNHNAMAIYPPPDVRAPLPTDLPFALPLQDFAAPAGTFDWRIVTGHFTHPDVDQEFEIVRVTLYGAGGQVLATLVSVDVPTADATHETVIPGVVTSAPVVQVKVTHGYSGIPVTEPSYSVTIQSLSFSCPAVR